MENILTTYEDISIKYNVRFSNEKMLSYNITEQEIVEIFNNKEEINEKFLERAEIDTSGVYYNIFGLWNVKVKNDIVLAYYYFDKSAELGYMAAIFNSVLFFNSKEFLKHKYKLMSYDKAIEYCKEIVKSGEYVKIYSIYAEILFMKYSFTQQLTNIHLQEVYDIAAKGMELRDCNSFLLSCKINLITKNISTAEEHLNMAEECLEEDPNIDIEKMRILINHYRKCICNNRT